MLASTALLTVLIGCQPAPAERVQRAESFMKDGDYRAAVIEVKNALRRDPDNIDARLILAASSAQLGDIATAVSEYERVLGLGGTGEHVWLGLGRSLLEQGRATEIVERVLPNLDEQTTNVDVLVLQGDSMTVLSNFEDAEEFYGRALELEPGNAPALVGMAVIASGRSDESEAESFIERAIELNPESDFAWRAKGNFLRTHRKLSEAARAYAKSTSLETPHTSLADQFITRVNHVGVLLDSRDIDAAAARLEELSALLPQHPLLNYLRGRLAYDRGEFDQAQAYLQEYLAQIPSDVRGQAMLGAVNFSQNHFRQAEVYLSQAVGRNFGGDQTRRLLAETQLRLNKPGDALQSLGSFDADSADDPIMLMMLGRAQLGLGNNEAALAYLRQGVETDPDNPATQLSLVAGLLASEKYDQALGVLESMPQFDDPEFRAEKLRMALHVKRGDKESAIAVADAVMRENSDNSTAYSMAGGLHGSIGDQDKARSLFDQAIELDAGDLTALFGLGDLELSNDDKAAAESLYSKALDVDAGFTPALVRITQLLVSADRFDELRPRFAAAIERNPTVLAPHILRARAAIATGRYSDALEFVADSRESHADAPLLDHAEGLSLMNTGQVELGLRKLALAADGAPNTPIVQLDAARYRLRNGDYRGAETVIARYRELQPAKFAGLAVLSEARARDGRADLARRDLAVFRAAYGESVDLQVLAGDIETYDKKPAAALEHYEAAASQLWARPIVLRLATAAQAAKSDRAVLVLEQWLSENPDDLEVRRVFAQILEARGNRTAAMQQYERVLEQGAEDAISLNNLAWRYMEEGRSGAVELAERAHELEPDNGSISDTLAWILYRDGQVERAEGLLRAAALQSPNNLDIKYHLAAVLAKTGQNSEAKSILADLLAGEQPFASRHKALELAKSL